MPEDSYIPQAKNDGAFQDLKRRRANDGHTEFSRRDRVHDVQPASIYSNVKENKPAWMRSADENKDKKYDQYGSRVDNGTLQQSLGVAKQVPTASASTTTVSAKVESSSAEKAINTANPPPPSTTTTTPSSTTSSSSSFPSSSSLYLKYGNIGLGGRGTDPRMDRVKRNREQLEQSLSIREHLAVEENVNDEGSQPKGDGEVNPYLHLDVANPSVIHTQRDEAHYRTFHSKISDRENRDINSIVRQHYNERTQQSKRQGRRTMSPIYKLRNFNNTIKYILLGNWAKYSSAEGNAPKIFSVLDLCCGKGGDLNKCEFIEIDQYIGIDISDLSVREAFSRYSKQKARFKSHSGARTANKYNFEACFATGDCFTETVPDILEPNFPGIIDQAFPVDAVSIQFALHYAFETEEKVRALLVNVAKSLRVGGTFIGTIPSSDFIRSKIVEKNILKDENGKFKFGNSLYSATFDKEPPADGVFRPAFGNRYTYWLKDAVDNVPEYVVPFETLRALCEEYNMTLRYKKNFIDVFNQEIPKYFSKLNKSLVEGLKRSDGKYGAEGEEKEAVAFYVAFVFEKVT